MGNKRFFNSKTGKGLVSIVTIIVLLSSILATTFVYENNITANVAREISINAKQVSIPIKEANGIRELSSLNEGWYYIRNGYVYYLEHFDSYVPLYIRVKNLGQQNGLLLVDENGKVMLDESFSGLAEKKSKADNDLRESSGQGLGAISGRVVSAAPPEVGELELVGEEGVSKEIRVGSTTLFGAIEISQSYRYNGDADIWEKHTFFGGWGEDTGLLAHRDYENGIEELREMAKSRDLTIWVGSEKEKEPVKDLNTLEEKARGDLMGVYKAPDQSLVRGRTPKEARTRWEARDSNYDGSGLKIEEISLNAPASAPQTQTIKYFDATGTNELKTQPVSGRYIKEDGAKRELYDGNTLIKTQIKTDGGWRDVQELKTWEYKKGENWYPLGEYSNLKEALKEAEGISTTVREQTVPTAVGDKWNVYSKDGTFLDSITAPPKDANVANVRGQKMAKSMGKEFGWVEYPKFKLSHPATGEKIYEVPDLATAKAKFREESYLEPETFEEIKPGTAVVSGNNYLIVDKKTGQRIVTLNNVPSDERADELLSYYKNIPLHSGKELEKIKIPTIDNLKKQYPNVPVHILQKELQAYTAPQAIEPSQQIITPKYYEFEVAGKKVYYVNDDRYDKEGDAKVAFNKATQDYNKAVAEKYAKAELKGKTLTGEITPDGELLAKDSKGVYKFVPSKDAVDNIVGGTFLSVGESYQTLQTIGEGTDTVNVERTYDTKTRAQTKVEVTKGGISATVDEETVNKIRSSEGKGISIKAEENNRILEFRDPQTNVLQEKRTFSKDSVMKADLTIIKTDSKTIEKFRTAYFFEGKEIKKEDYDKLIKEGKKPQEFLELTAAKLTEEKVKEIKDGKEVTSAYLTTYQPYVVFDKDKKAISAYEATKTDQKTGKVVEFTYGEGDKKIVINKLTGDISGDTGDATLIEKAKRLDLQRASRQFFATAERILTQFQGLAYYQTLFIDEDAILRWQDDVDRAFATLYLGTEYWSSKICRHYLDGEDIGIAYAETPQGLAQIGAHIEATRTEPILTDKGREFIYKITFNVRNGDFKNDLRAPEEMNINIFLTGERTATVFRQDQKIKRGSQLGRAGRNAIVQESKALYTEVCIKFDDIPLKWKLDNKELCNTIVESSGEAATTAAAAAAAAGSQGSGTAGTTGEGDINDF